MAATIAHLVEQTIHVLLQRSRYKSTLCRLRCSFPSTLSPRILPKETSTFFSSLFSFLICFHFCLYYFFFLLSCVGAVSLRMDTVRVLTSAESSRVSLQGVSLSVIKTVTENMEVCCPASQTINPIAKLTTLTLWYHITTHTIQVTTFVELNLSGLNKFPSQHASGIYFRVY